MQEHHSFLTLCLYSDGSESNNPRLNSKALNAATSVLYEGQTFVNRELFLV